MNKQETFLIVLAFSLTAVIIAYNALKSPQLSPAAVDSVSVTSTAETSVVVTSTQSDTADTTSDSFPVNINKADKSALMSLPGIGEKKADAIIEYRNENGSFNSVDDLTLVSGIGSKTLESLRTYITV